MVSRSLEATLAQERPLVVDDRGAQPPEPVRRRPRLRHGGLALRPTILIEQVTYDGRPAAPGQRFIRSEHRVVRTRSTGPVSAAHAGEGTTLHLASGGTVTRWFS